MLDLDTMAAEARERVHRSIGQRARWAKWALMREVRAAKKQFAPRVLTGVNADVVASVHKDYVDAMMNEPEMLRAYRQGQMMLGFQWSEHERAAAMRNMQQGQQALMNVGSAGGLLINMIGKRVLP